MTDPGPPALTEARFKELYELASELHARGATGAARELLLVLFDHGATVGGYGVVRLTFVLQELAEIAELENPERDVEAERAREAMVDRRNARESWVRRGEAGFTEIQELLALNRHLGEPQRSIALERELEELTAGDEATPALDQELATLNELLASEVTTSRDPEELARQILAERLKSRILELAGLAAEMAAAYHLRQTLADEASSRRRVAELTAELDHHCSRLLARGTDGGRARPGSDVVLLARDTSGRLREVGVVGELPSGEEGQHRVTDLARELSRLIETHRLGEAPPRGEELFERIRRLARDVATRIARERVRQDFQGTNGTWGEKIDETLAERILGEGLLAYEVLLRIDEEGHAERVAAWLLSFRQDEEMYLRLLSAARSAKKRSIENRLNEEARRLLLG